VRSAVRVIVQDADGAVLLLHANDVDNLAFGRWWELPGGGIDPGETYLEAAVRELREETGFVVEPSHVSAPTWRRHASFAHRRRRLLQTESIVWVRLHDAQPAIDTLGRFDYENEDYVDYRWWPIPDIVASAERFYPGHLPELIEPFLWGDPIDEPFELWS
jgi:8-oxo-dGTP pyrophosphatase MutT (NUDIX family)